MAYRCLWSTSCRNFDGGWFPLGNGNKNLTDFGAFSVIIDLGYILDLCLLDAPVQIDRMQFYLLGLCLCYCIAWKITCSCSLSQRSELVSLSVKVKMYLTSLILALSSSYRSRIAYINLSLFFLPTRCICTQRGTRLHNRFIYRQK